MSLLPSEFGDLEPYAEKWCLGSERERYAVRLATPMPEMIAFYDAIAPRAEAALAYLEPLPLDKMPADGTNLLHLLYSMVMVSFPVEAWGQQKVPDTGSATFDCFLEPRP